MTERRTPYRDADGVRRTLITDDERPEDFVVETSQDIEPILASIARDRETMRHGVNKVVARLPVPIVERFFVPGVGWDNEMLDAFLNSDEGRPWRIWMGRV